MKTIGEDLDEFMNFIGYDMNDKKGEEENKIVNENQEIKEKFFETEVKDEAKDIDNNNDVKDNKNENNKKDDNDKNMKIIFSRFENITKFTESFKNLNEIFKFKNDKITKYLYSLRESSNKIFLFSEKLVSMTMANWWMCGTGSTCSRERIWLNEKRSIYPW